MVQKTPGVPPAAFKTERAWIALRNVFEALVNYELISNRELPPAALAGWHDIAAAANEVIFGAGDLAASQRARRDHLVEDARIAQQPQRQRRKPEVPPIKKVS